MSIKQKIASKICISKPDFKKEHVNLLKVLKTGKGLKAEYKDQAKELKAKIKKPIPEKYRKAVEESNEYMNKTKEHKSEMKGYLKAYKK